MSRRSKMLATLATVVLPLAACTTTYGSRTVAPARFDYNQAIVHSRDQQLLLNLVRLRYRDTPLFLEITEVTTQYELDGTAQAGVSLGDTDTYDLGLGVTYTEKPTVKYIPLQGKDYVERVSKGIDPETLEILAHSGWSIERLLLCCVEELHEISNFASASGPTPEYVPETVIEEFARFEKISSLLRELQIEGELPLTVEENHVSEASSAQPPVKRLHLSFGAGDGDEISEELEEIRKLMGADKGSETRLRPRSLMGVLFYLSQGVDVPPEHEEAGLVTRTEAGSPKRRFDWRPVKDKLLHVRVSREEPRDAFVRVHYRGHWFYIADDDLNSKTTFFLLTYLFSIQSTTPQSSSPLLLSL